MNKALAWRAKYFFDKRAAKRATNFFQSEIQHVEGAAAWTDFKLEPWQRKVVRRIFGWKHRSSGARKFRRIFIFIPRKNGKTFLAAGISLYLLFADREQGAQIVCAASDSEQAALTYNVAKENILRNKKLKKLAGRPYRRSVYVQATNSILKVVSSTPGTKHGTNLHGVVIDELHAQPNQELIDALVTSVGTRKQPLIVYLTTAGYDKNSICGQIYEYATGVHNGTIPDEAFMPVLFAAEKDDDWTLETTWRKANPNLGVTVPVEFLRGECEIAKRMPSYQNTFRRLYLNQWTEQDERWLPMDAWNICGPHFTEESLRGRECFGGLDLSTTTDVAAFVLVFTPQFPEEGIHVISRFWVPQETILERQRKGEAGYFDWARDKFISATEGNVIDYDFIRRDINDLAEIFNVREIAIDRWNATQLATQLTGDGRQVLGFGQGFASMSAPSKFLEVKIMEGTLWHNHNPVLTWMASNAAKEEDAAGNIKPSKKKAKQRIDGIVSLVMALARLSAATAAPQSVYKNRGLLVV